jgi:hypothetical protein
MDELDQQLRQLVEETCGHPQGSLARQKGLNRIIWQVQRSHKLLRGVGVPDYEDALQQTWLYFCRNLCEAVTGDRYDPNRASVTTWLNAYLKRRLQDLRQQAIQQKEMTIQSPLSDSHPLDFIENLPDTCDSSPLLEDVRLWIQQEGQKLRRIHLRDRPDVNCQVLLLRRLPPETPWKELSQEFGVAIPTLSSFYQRECLPRLLEFGKRQGYIEV